MRKIKCKPVKRLRFRPSNGVQFVYCLPLEGVLFNQAEYERREKEKAWGRLTARLRGEPVEPEPNYCEGFNYD